LTFFSAPAIITTAPTLETESNPPTLTRKRSKLLQFSRTKQDETQASESEDTRQSSSNGPKQSMDKKRSLFSGVMASKDPASELRKLAGARLEAQMRSSDTPKDSKLLIPNASDSPLPSGNVSASSGDVSPGVESIQSLFDDSSKSRSFSFLPRKQRIRKSIFPLRTERPEGKSHTAPPTAVASPRPSTSIIQPDMSASQGTWPRFGPQSSLLSSQDPTAASSSASITFAPHPTLGRTSSVISDRSTKSSPALALPNTLRNRSSTVDSGSGRSEETPPTPPFANGGSGRTSTSTAGRSSFSNLFHIGQRFRQQDAQSPRQGSSTNILSSQLGFASGSNSMSISRDAISLPDREEGEAAIQYLKRVEELTPRSQIPSILSKRVDDFYYAVMRSFMRTYLFFGDPLDMAIRKLLIEIVLPKETQQIDRVLQSFSDRYQECNPGVFDSSGLFFWIVLIIRANIRIDKVHVTTFSILMLHTDAFNKNNKKKMSKPEYLKNLSGQGLSDDVLECFYDNVIYTPFIHLEDDQDIITLRTRKTDRKTAKAAKAAKAAIKSVPTDSVKRSPKEPLDPYTLIFETRLDTLRPSLKTIIQFDDPYSYLGSLPVFDYRVLRNSKIGIIQIESKRSRPDAFMSASGIENPDEAKFGLVDLPVDKVGVLWRKDPKKKTARSPWQEWGAILTGAGLYFFKNAGWVKNYLHQFENWLKHGGTGTPCMFKPPITSFKADYMVPTDHCIALQDATYKRHKNAFTFFRHNNSEEIFLADNEWEMNDWLARLNHQSACKTAGIRQRGPVGGNYDGQRQRGIRRLEGSGANSSTLTIQTPTGDVTIQSGKIDTGLAQQINEARREAIEQKIQEAEEKIAVTSQELENELRDARHLLILAPIQQKTREQVVLAAARTEAKVKWMRVEIWRLKCHRDILQMDLNEERREFEKRQARIEKINGKPPSRGTLNGVKDSDPNPSTLDKIPSNKSGSTTGTAARIPSPTRPNHAVKPSQVSIAASTESTGEENDIYHTPLESNFPETTPTQSPSGTSVTSISPRKAPPHTLHGHSLSINSTYSHTSRLQPRAPRPSLDEPIPSPSASDYQDAITSEDETDGPRSEAGDLPETSKADTSRPTTPASLTRPKSKPDDLSGPSTVTSTPDQKKSRRRSSLQPSGRDGNEGRAIMNHGSRKNNKPGSKDIKDTNAGEGSSLSAATSTNPSVTNSPAPKSKHLHPDDEPDSVTGLRRDTVSFTIHGKKASVVSFGGEWATNAEETLQRMKAATSSSPTEKGKEPAAQPPPLVRSPLSRSLSTAAAVPLPPPSDGDADTDSRDDVTIRELDTDVSTTPTPGSPGGEAVRPPRRSSLRANGSNRRTSFTSHKATTSGGTRSIDVSVEEESERKTKQPIEGAVEA
jgi:Sec7 domain